MCIDSLRACEIEGLVCWLLRGLEDRKTCGGIWGFCSKGTKEEGRFMKREALVCWIWGHYSFGPWLQEKGHISEFNFKLSCVWKDMGYHPNHSSASFFIYVT